MAAPMQLVQLVLGKSSQLIEILFVCCLFHILVGVVSSPDGFEGFLLCRKCGYEVVQAANLIPVPSSKAHRQRNDTIAMKDAVLIQLFKNPEGVYFEVITATSADVEKSKQKFEEHSWFPGYAWSIAICPKCGAHLGWSFDVIENYIGHVSSHLSSFVGIILDKVMHEEDVSNLIATPKVYLS